MNLINKLNDEILLLNLRGVINYLLCDTLKHNVYLFNKNHRNLLKTVLNIPKHTLLKKKFDEYEKLYNELVNLDVNILNFYKFFLFLALHFKLGY